MKITDAPFLLTDYYGIPAESHAGEHGTALWHTRQNGNVRTRIVEYSAGYLADHWCSKGHVVFVLEGELITELKDGRSFVMHPGMSYQVSDDDIPHRSRTNTGAKIFIVD
jgi:quercetin dioxygenase-like cupin family protein